jgi:hypothetical protein
MRAVPVVAVGSVPAAIVERARLDLGERRTLAEVLAWAREQSPPREVVEIVTQDEYTHDVVVPFEGDCFLVFDTT